jgi:centromere protein C
MQTDQYSVARVTSNQSAHDSRRSNEVDRILSQSMDDSVEDEAYNPEPSPEMEMVPENVIAFSAAAKKGRGRPKKSQGTTSQKNKNSSVRSQGSKRKALDPAPAERGPNARMEMVKRQKSGSPKRVERAASAQENRRPGPRSLQILRQGTPAEEAGMQTTRFGRASVKPVAWWCGERVDRDYDGTIKNIVRAQSVESTKQTRTRTVGRKPSRAPRDMSVLKEEDEEDIEDWELEPGIITGQVRVWDAEQSVGVEELDNETGKCLQSKINTKFETDDG